MRARRLVAVAASAAVAFCGAALMVPQTSAAPAVAQADPPPVAKRVGTLDGRPAGLPSTGVAARQIASASVTTVVREDRARATVVLRAVPALSEQAYLQIGLGKRSGSSCSLHSIYETRTHGTPDSGWTKSGATYQLNDASNTVHGSYDCAVAVTDSIDNPGTTWDALVGALAPVYAKPKLKVLTPKLLGSKKLKLVRGVWTPIVVEVRNVGDHDAGAITVKGSGKALKVKKGKIDYDVRPGSTGTVKLRVKLTKKRSTKLKLVATTAGAGKATRKAKVTSVKAPKRIRNGKYRSQDKRVTFTVKRGKITGFRASALTTCGGYPDLPTYTWNTYSIPSKKVPKSGVVDIVEKGNSPRYTATLTGMAKGKQLTKAKFGYNGPNRCWATVSFTAKRVGK